MTEERLPVAKRDTEALQLPARLDCFPDRALNRQLYFWLAAFLGDGGWDSGKAPADALQADVLYLRNAAGAAERTCRRYPGLRDAYRELSEAALAMRPARRLPELEAAVEAAIVHLLGGPRPDDPSGKAIFAAIEGESAALGALASAGRLSPASAAAGLGDRRGGWCADRRAPTTTRSCRRPPPATATRTLVTPRSARRTNRVNETIR